MLRKVSPKGSHYKFNLSLITSPHSNKHLNSVSQILCSPIKDRRRREEMGIGATLEYLSDLLSSSGHKRKKRKQLQTVELKVRMDCEGCELKVKNTLSSMKGFASHPSYQFFLKYRLIFLIYHVILLDPDM